jgi:hypothetical protein
LISPIKQDKFEELKSNLISNREAIEEAIFLAYGEDSNIFLFDFLFFIEENYLKIKR